MPSQEEIRNEAPVLFGEMDVLKQARKTVAERIAEQEWGLLASFLDKYASHFTQVVLARDEGCQDLLLARLLGQLKRSATPGSPLQYGLFLVVPKFSNQTAIVSCVIDEKGVFHYLPGINPRPSRDELSAAARAYIGARLETKEEVLQVVIPKGFLAFRFDAMWAAGGYDDDHPTTFEAVIEADDIHSGFETFKERLRDGWWRGQKNFVGNFWVAVPLNRDGPHCGEWHRLNLVSESGKRPPVEGHFWSIDFDWPKAKLADEPAGLYLCQEALLRK